jgi:antagonist of KipI
MSLRVLTPGALTTVQDRGRTGFRHHGVGCAGALDAYSYQVANLLAGNAVDAPALEITLRGPTLRVERAARIAICGADIDARLDGLPLPGWRSVRVPAGSELVLGSCRHGARAYLAIDGGLEVAPVMGSASTDLRGGFGGLRGRALVVGDVLPLRRSRLAAMDALQIPAWSINPSPDLELAAPARARVLPGADVLVDAAGLFARDWRIASASDRQALRLEGPPLQPREAGERLSAAVAPGTLQLPPDGRPIVLLADAQTVGGYPRIGHVISADLPRLAQLRPGETLRLVACTPEAANRAACEQRARLARIGIAIAHRLGA